MKSTLARVLLAAFLVVVLAGAWYGPLDRVAMDQVDAGLKRSLISFATARGLNGVISMIQGTQVSVQPLGIGTTFSIGQILRPINDLTAQFAELMLAASIAFGVMKALISIGSFWVISLLVSVAGLYWGWMQWRGRNVPGWIGRAFFLLLFVRFAVPLVTVGSDAVFQRFLLDDYTRSQKAIEGDRDEFITLAPNIDENNAAKDAVEGIRAWWSKINLGESVHKLKNSVARVTEHIVKLIVVFLMQTLVIPLILLWALYKGSLAVLPALENRLTQLVSP